MSARFGIRAFRAQMPARQVNTNMRFAQRRTYQSAAENPNNIEAPKAGKLVQLWNSPVGPKTVHFWAPIMKVSCDMSLPGLRREEEEEDHERRAGKAKGNLERHPACNGLIEEVTTNGLANTIAFFFPQWGLVLAGAADFARPASDLSLSQNAALTCTGLIWTRWCFIIKPRNMFLASVNFLLFCVGATQTTRVLLYNRSLKNDSVVDVAKVEAGKDASAIEKIVEDPKAALKSVTNPK
jgi:hypothetical protein